MIHVNFDRRIDKLENDVRELQEQVAQADQPAASAIDYADAVERIGLLEAQQHELASAILDYVRADLAAPWMDAAKRLQATLVRLIRDRE
jgi:uncharacterized protein with PIN domain